MERIKLDDKVAPFGLTMDGTPKKSKGGRRPGAGRRWGAHNKLSVVAREEAKKRGILPHEFLLSIVQTGFIQEGRRKIRVDLPTRLEAAKAAAPYYQPKLSSVTQQGQMQVSVLQISPERLKRLSADELSVLERVLDGLQRGDTSGESGEAATGDENLYAAAISNAIN